MVASVTIGAKVLLFRKKNACMFFVNTYMSSILLLWSSSVIDVPMSPL